MEEGGSEGPRLGTGTPPGERLAKMTWAIGNPHPADVSLTCVVFDQLLQGWEGAGRRDEVASHVQRADLVVFHHVAGGVRCAISDGQREGTLTREGGRDTSQR